MKIYLETKDVDHHRIVFVGNNGKLVFSGEWMRRKMDARRVTRRLVDEIKRAGGLMLFEMQSRPYKPGAFAKNAGPKKAKPSTKKK